MYALSVGNIRQLTNILSLSPLWLCSVALARLLMDAHNIRFTGGSCDISISGGKVSPPEFITSSLHETVKNKTMIKDNILFFIVSHILGKITIRLFIL